MHTASHKKESYNAVEVGSAMMRQKAVVNTLIIGGGPAGIGAALKLGTNALFLEKSAIAGGMSTSVEFAGAVFDLGGHSFHTPHPHVRKLVFDALEMQEQERDARCFHQGQYIAYPFQKHFRRLACPTTVAECAQGAANGNARAAANFEEYITARFGTGIARHFMLPYNRKLWGDDLKRIEVSWVNERVAAPEGEQQRFLFDGGVRKPLQTTTQVAYPARGGFVEIFRALARQIQAMALGIEVVRIAPSRKTVRCANGDTYKYENLVSTLPLPTLLNITEDVPATLRASVTQLEAVGLQLVLLAVGKRIDTEIQRIYSSESWYPAHKTALNHNSSNYLRSLPTHGVIAEISTAQSVVPPRHDIERRVVEGLIQMGILRSPSEVIEARILDLPRAYPVPRHDRQRIVDLAKAWLQEHDIFTIGRFGEWAYINSDEALHRGLKTGEAILGGKALA